jgi:glyoxylase-like metal-dependent hydrolase (beta-lactamase superfamily II)
MKVIKLKRNPNEYTCNAYLVLGSWNRIQDKNTLIDVGYDAYIIDEIEKINTGVGKNPIDQVVITHSHYDHTAGLPAIISKYKPVVYGNLKSQYVDVVLKDGDTVMIGDNEFDVIEVPTHSDDSILLYCKKEGILFAGDTTLTVRSSEGNYDRKFIDTLKYLSNTNIKTIYHGHDDPIIHEALHVILNSLNRINKKELNIDELIFYKLNLEACNV